MVSVRFSRLRHRDVKAGFRIGIISRSARRVGEQIQRGTLKGLQCLLMVSDVTL